MNITIPIVLIGVMVTTAIWVIGIIYRAGQREAKLDARIAELEKRLGELETDYARTVDCVNKHHEDLREYAHVLALNHIHVDRNLTPVRGIPIGPPGKHPLLEEPDDQPPTAPLHPAYRRRRK